MGTPTYTALANITLGSAAASVTFSSISQAYRDLVLVVTGTTTGSSGYDLITRFNNDSGSNYYLVYMQGNGSGGFSGTATQNTAGVMYSNFLNNTPMSSLQFSIMDYSASDKHKSYLSRSGPGSAQSVEAVAGRWASTSAITSLNFSVSGTTLAAGSTFALYGIAA